MRSARGRSRLASAARACVLRTYMLWGGGDGTIKSKLKLLMVFIEWEKKLSHSFLEAHEAINCDQSPVRAPHCM